MLVNESDLALWTKRDRKTVRSKLIDLDFKRDGNAKLYESHIALGILYGASGNSKAVSQQEAAKLLTIKRTEEIELNMEVTRRERIPLEEVEEHNDKVLQTVAAIFKTKEGKVLTGELIQELFAELRRMEEILTEYCRKATPPPAEKQVEEAGMDDPLF